MPNGWEQSAAAWIASLGRNGDFSRQFVLDRPMLQRIDRRRPKKVLDVGCGEGRFCRMLRGRGIETVGVDPVKTLIDYARSLDADGKYQPGDAEALDFPDASFDMAVAYLTLLDIDNIDSAVAEIVRVVKPGGFLLIANINGFATAGNWQKGVDEHHGYRIDDYMTARAEWVEWDNVRVRNWHRPFDQYMGLLLSQGLLLRHFEEPLPYGGNRETVDRYKRVPWFHIMEWEKPAGR